MWEVHINGGRVPTGLEAVAWAREVQELGAGEIVLTSMDADGTKDGYDLPMTRAVADAVEIPVVASGGAGRPEHLRAALVEGGASAALAASIFHYREYSIAQTKSYLAAPRGPREDRAGRGRGRRGMMARPPDVTESRTANPPNPARPPASIPEKRRPYAHG